MVEDMNTGRFDTLIVSIIDRISRSPLELELFMRKTNEYGVELKDTTELDKKME